MLAARAQKANLAADHIARAREYAEKVGDASLMHWLNFNAANVALHEMSVAMETRQYDEALRQAKRGVRGNGTQGDPPPSARRDPDHYPTARHLRGE